MNLHQIKVPLNYSFKQNLEQHLMDQVGHEFDTFEFFEEDVVKPEWKRTTPGFNLGIQIPVNAGSKVLEALKSYNKSNQKTNKNV